MKARIFICVIERSSSGRFNWAELKNKHCVLVPAPFAGASDDSVFQWWWQS